MLGTGELFLKFYHVHLRVLQGGLERRHLRAERLLCRPPLLGPGLGRPGPLDRRLQPLAQAPLPLLGAFLMGREPRRQALSLLAALIKLEKEPRPLGLGLCALMGKGGLQRLHPLPSPFLRRTPRALLACQRLPQLACLHLKPLALATLGLEARREVHDAGVAVRHLGLRHRERLLGAATVRMDHNTSATVLNLDDRLTQFKLDQGTLNVRVLRMAADEVYEVDTPNLAFSIQRPGRYRIDVDLSGDTTYVAVREGEGEAYGEGTAYLIRSQQSYRFSGTDLRSYEAVELPPPDDFERWCSDRDRRQHNARSARHVSVDVIGYEDLDDYGTWHTVEDYGEVWTPIRVAPDWAPYRTGRWAWIDPWGWTWVDDEPWGFAPFHYGRWVHIGEEWSWVPGPAESRLIYALALVAFIGGGLSLALSGGQTTPDIAWFPLGPGDVYQPAYPASRDYFTEGNITNTRIDRSYVTSVYNNPSAIRLRYLNRQVPGAIVAVPAAAFIGARPVSRAAVPVARDFLGKAPVTAVAPVAPVRASVTGGAPPVPNKRPLHVSDRPAVVIHAPPAPIGFAAKEGLLGRRPGKPFDANAMSVPRPVTPLAPKLRLVKQVQPVIPVPKLPTGPAAPPVTPTGPAAPATHPLGIPPVMSQGAEHKPEAPPQPTQGRPAIPSGARPEGIPVPRPPQPELQEHRAAPPPRAEVPHPPAHPAAPPAPPAAAQPEHRPAPAPAAPHPAAPPKAGGKAPPQQEQDKKQQTGG